jgi:ABC-type proline/glycine betaine transport system permease subunit
MFFLKASTISMRDALSAGMYVAIIAVIMDRQLEYITAEYRKWIFI